MFIKNINIKRLSSLITLVILLIIIGAEIYFFIVLQQGRENLNKNQNANRLINSNLSANQNTNDSADISNDPTADWQIYRNEKYGFGVRYPPGWESSEKEEDLSITKSTKHLFSFRMQTADEQKVASIGVFDNSENLSLGKWIDAHQRTEYSFEEATVDGEKGRKYSITPMGQKADQYLIPFGNKIYFLGSTNFLEFTQILSSFHILKDMAGWKMYQGKKYDFEMKYPTDWYYSEFTTGVLFNPYPIRIIPDSESPIPTITITIDEQKSLDEKIKQLRGVYKFSNYKETDVLIDGSTGKRISGVVTGESYINGRYYVAVLFNKKNAIYSISCTHETKEYLSVFNAMVLSLKFINTGETADWQIYRNQEIGIEFKYPPEWIIKERQWGQFHLISPNDIKILNTPGYTDQPLGFGISASYTSYQSSLEAWLANHFHLSVADVIPTNKRKNDIKSITKIVIGENYQGYLFHELGLGEGSYSHFAKSGEVVVSINAFYENSLFDPLFQGVLNSVRLVSINKIKDWKMYESPNLRYSIHYPSSWTASSLSDIYSEFNNPQSDDDYIRNQNVGAPLEMTQDGVWITAELYSLNGKSFGDTIADLSKKYDIVSKESMVVNGNEAIRQVENDKPDFEGEAGYHVVTYIYTGNKVHKFSALSLAQDPYKKYETDIDRIIRSFELKYQY